MNRNPGKVIVDQPLFADPTDLFGRQVPPRLRRNPANSISESGISAASIGDADPGPLVHILYLADDLRSVTFHGYDRLWPAKLDESLASLMFGHSSPLHRLTPTLWARVWRQVLALWDGMRTQGDAQKRNELLDLMEPVLDYVRELGWEPKPE